MPRGIEIGDRVRDANGVIWEHMHSDLGERWCIGVRPVGRLDDERVAHTREQVVAAIRVAPYSFDVRDSMLRLWDYDPGRGGVRWEEETWWNKQESLFKVTRVVPVPESAVVRCPKCGDTAKVRAGQKVELGVNCEPGHVRVVDVEVADASA